jgi:hypothetical protein
MPSLRLLPLRARLGKSLHTTPIPAIMVAATANTPSPPVHLIIMILFAITTPKIISTVPWSIGKTPFMPISVHLRSSATRKAMLFLHHHQPEQQHIKCRLPSWTQFRQQLEEWQKCWLWLLFPQSPTMLELTWCPVLTAQASAVEIYKSARKN